MHAPWEKGSVRDLAAQEGVDVKFWTRRRKGEVFPLLAEADRRGELERAVADVALRYGRPADEVLAMYRRTRDALAEEGTLERMTGAGRSGRRREK